jgi:hypothetical protein
MNTLLQNPNIVGLTEAKYSDYLTDLCKPTNAEKIRPFFGNLTKNAKGLLEKPVAKVYLAGKVCEIPVILALNRGLDRKDSKADVYVEYTDGEFVGISIKTTTKDTKTNFSVDSILSRFNKANGIIIKEIRHKMLKKAGLYLTNEEKREIHRPENRGLLVKYRGKVNALFYDPNNELFQKYRELIAQNADKIMGILIGYIYSFDVPYKMFEIDDTGVEWLQENRENMDYGLCHFKEHEEYYLTKCGEKRECAKLFYQLAINGRGMAEKKYRVELRWKNDIQDSSPQFLTHNE